MFSELKEERLLTQAMKGSSVLGQMEKMKSLLFQDMLL